MCKVQVKFQDQEKWHFWTRLLACGYNQIPRIDISENYASVVHVVTFRLLLILKIVYGFITKIADIWNSILWGDLEEEIFMNCPEGLKGAKHIDT